MTDLTDEITSALIARAIREVQNFAVNATFQDGAGTEQMWSHFVDYLIRRKELEGQR